MLDLVRTKSVGFISRSVHGSGVIFENKLHLEILMDKGGFA
jgi:hypothetical protein